MSPFLTITRVDGDVLGFTATGFGFGLVEATEVFGFGLGVVEETDVFGLGVVLLTLRVGSMRANLTSCGGDVFEVPLPDPIGDRLAGGLSLPASNPCSSWGTGGGVLPPNRPPLFHLDGESAHSST